MIPSAPAAVLLVGIVGIVGMVGMDHIGGTGLLLLYSFIKQTNLMLTLT